MGEIWGFGVEWVERCWGLCVGLDDFRSEMGEFSGENGDSGAEFEAPRRAWETRSARVRVVATPLPSRCQSLPSRNFEEAPGANSDPNTSNLSEVKPCSTGDNGGKSVEKSAESGAAAAAGDTDLQRIRGAKPGAKTPEKSPFIRAANEDDDGYDPYSDRPAETHFFEPNPWD